MNRLRTADLEHHGGETVWSKAAHFMEIEKWGGGGEKERKRGRKREKEKERDFPQRYSPSDSQSALSPSVD